MEPQLIERELQRVADGVDIGFRHDLVREAFYAALGPSRRREIHRDFADHYLAAGQTFLAASHARAAHGPGDVRAAEIMVSAAEALIEVNAQDAGELASSAFHTLRVTQPEWLDLSRRCLTVLCRTERVADAIAVADLIAAQADDADLIGEVETRIASALWLSGRVNELRARADRALRAREYLADDQGPNACRPDLGRHPAHPRRRHGQERGGSTERGARQR